MKEFFTKAFAAELKKQGYEISPRTLEGWRISHKGYFFSQTIANRLRLCYNAQ
ncbi:MAG: hypothetical protein IJQ82_06615 [Selenomonadaceae bacterium]|nr:hypothetical protein [Selenomonadaceae bacterium]